jgi:hypothetical protein
MLLIPLDSRPAAGQFAQMIGKIAGVDVDIPPMEYLGRFTEPGNPEEILNWIESQDLSEISHVIVSADMLAYGGLVASRENLTPVDIAVSRLKRLSELKEKAPNLKVFVFATTMRLTPTATIRNASWRADLAKYEELKDRFERTGEEPLVQRIQALKNKLPAKEVIAYEKTRSRNHKVQIQLMQQTIGPGIDFLLMGQDDAKPDGPHIQENEVLRKLANTYRLRSKLFFCEGIDQHSNLLLSRAILETQNFRPKVKVTYSDPLGPDQYALYESKPIKESLIDQLFAAGAEIATDPTKYDYTLYVNTPKRRDSYLQAFLQRLRTETDQGLPVALADINFGPDGASDEQVYNTIAENRRSQSLLAFAGWNTAGNTMGTAIPAANVYLAARRSDDDPLAREVAQKEFLYHRIVNDWAYHKYTRVSTYRLIESLQRQRDEVYGINFRTINSFVSRDLSKLAESIFVNQFENVTFSAGSKQYRLKSLDQLQIGLPWPRAYETRLEFKFGVQEVKDGEQKVKVR